VPHLGILRFTKLSEIRKEVAVMSGLPQAQVFWLEGVGFFKYHLYYR